MCKDRISASFTRRSVFAFALAQFFFELFIRIPRTVRWILGDDLSQLRDLLACALSPSLSDGARGRDGVLALRVWSASGTDHNGISTPTPCRFKSALRNADSRRSRRSGMSRDGKVTSRGTLCTEPSSCNTNHVERCIRTMPL